MLDSARLKRVQFFYFTYFVMIYTYWQRRMASSRKPLNEEELGRYAEDIMSESSDDCIQDPNFKLTDSENESEFFD
ncbi:unnamed protein product [Didymodactylos carnosus]|uniref:Uncharacterized protein n=1 Tax=Didymodactylos carnosus TaxID=1234261 RepID=A0A815VMJ2_9BILA|nr:unnamed protein product [Didymodactylos carnosus]CAF1554188.1 unnamed protein product [Didymodactylos carnosus]CAF4344837.1 unnamed protein product [Didymodactylos carnosus]CAF4391632.1 unnamed protein product [Didymodactylos carnosus]